MYSQKRYLCPTCKTQLIGRLKACAIHGQVEPLVENVCNSCGKPDSERPMAFKGLSYCSDNCRKILEENQ